MSPLKTARIDHWSVEQSIAPGPHQSFFSSHSAKRGIATELAHHDADVRQIMSVTGHKSANVALGYVEEAERFEQSPLRLLGL